MDWESIVTIVGSIAGIMGLFFTWMNGNIIRLDRDIKNLGVDMKSIAKEAKDDSRSLNARVDLTQSIIMRMLEKQGK